MSGLPAQAFIQSNRFAIPPQPPRQSQQRRRNDQPNPQARAAQESSRSKLRQRNKMRIDEDAVFIGELESFRSETKEPVAQQGVHIRSAERNPFEDAERQRRQHSP